MEDINRDPLSGQPFLFSLPFLNEFCHKFDYSYQMDMFYDHLKACKNSGQALVLAACIPTSIFSSDSQEAFFECTYSYRDCANDLKNFLALGDLVRYPQLINEGDGLLNYIDFLTGNSGTSQHHHHQPTYSTFFFFMILFILVEFYCCAN